MTGRAIPRPGRLLPLLLFAPAGLLFLPVFYYSLNTPFGLVDDYSIWKWVRIFDGWAEFYQWIDGQFLSLGYAAEAINPRHRPFYEFYNAFIGMGSA